MAMAKTKAMDSPSPLSRFDTIELGHHGLSLVPRLRFHLSFFRSDLSVTPFDEWQLRQSILSFVRDSLSLPVSDKDLTINRRKDSQRTRREEAVASGVLYIWDINAFKRDTSGKAEELDALVRKKESVIAEKLSGLELNLRGVKLKCRAHVDEFDDFASMKRSWHKAQESIHAELPDTIIIKGVPSRWLAELRISSKASVLVTHTIFSRFGKTRHVDVQDNDLETLSCDVWVQFEHYSSFYSAMRAFTGRSMVKDGSTFKANYQVNWDKHGYFTEENIRKRRFAKEQAEELQRRKLILEARQAENARRHAEAAARLEQERLETERVEREEDKLAKEREAARAEEERLQELQHQKEEKEIQQEKMQKEEDLKNLIEMMNWENELRKEEEQWKEKQWKTESQTEETHEAEKIESKLGHEEKTRRQRADEVDRLPHNHQRRGVQRSKENKPGSAQEPRFNSTLNVDMITKQSHAMKSIDGHHLGSSNPEELMNRSPRNQSPNRRESNLSSESDSSMAMRNSNEADGFERWVLYDASSPPGAIKTDGSDGFICSSKRLRSVIVDLRNA